MKTLIDLGISPAPWQVGDGVYRDTDGEIRCKSITRPGAYKVLATLNQNFNQYFADGKLISAAPELYEALYDACVSKCLRCSVGKIDTKTHYCGNACPTVKRWREILEKAGG